jgi:NDP-sugar pyrophosphorylase family protein
MGDVGKDEPKSLLPVAGEPFAARLVRQAYEHGITDVTVVTGFRADHVAATLEARAPGPLSIVHNARYLEDTNIHSLTLALEADARPCFVVEADIWMSDRAWTELLAAEDADASVWYTRGRFGSHQVGGILRAGPDRRVVDLRIVPAWDPKWAEHDKLVGVTKIGPAEAAPFLARLRAARDRNMKQYWLMPWIEDLTALPCLARDLGAEHAVSVNTREEYERLLAQVGR